MKVLAVLVMMLCAGAAAHGQDVRGGASWLFTDRDDMPGGPGAWLGLDWPVNRFVRFEVVGGRDWGSDTGRELVCDMNWPVPVNCVEEPTERKTTATRIEGHIVTMTPPFAGVRVGIAGGIALYDFDISRTGLTTRRTQQPASVDTEAPITSFMLLGAYSPAFLRRISIDARGQLTSIDFGSCAQDTWDVCGRESVRRLILGAGYRF